MGNDTLVSSLLYLHSVQDLTGIQLNDSIDLFCGKYRSTDYLLCHDDELEGRRIAFIYYLVQEDWTRADGGTLDLYTTDLNGTWKKLAILNDKHNS